MARKKKSKGKSWDKRIAKTSKTIEKFPIVAKIIIALFLEIAGFFIQPIPVLGPLFTLLLILMGYFMFGALGFLEAWEILFLPLAAWIPTLFIIGMTLALTGKKTKRSKR